jgi:hypothetical protein
MISTRIPGGQAVTSTKSKTESKPDGASKPARRRAAAPAAPAAPSRVEFFLQHFQTNCRGEISGAYGLGPWLLKNQNHLGTLLSICQTLVARYREDVSFFLSPDNGSSSSEVMLVVCLRHFDLGLLDALDELHATHHKEIAAFEPMLVIAPNFGQEEKAS